MVPVGPWTGVLDQAAPRTGALGQAGLRTELPTTSALGGSAGMEAGSARLARGGGREEEALLRPTVGEVSLWVPDLFTVYELNR